MKIKNRFFPYPVLSSFNDDIGGSFKVDIQIDSIGADFQFTVDFNLENETLQNLILANQAVYAVHLECSSTMQRLLKKTTLPSFSFSVNQKLLNNIVEINFFILAESQIESYVNSQFHEDFNGISFSLQKGDQLAFTDTVKMNINKEPITQTSSIFELAINLEENAPTIFVEYGEKIVIHLPKKTYEEINNLRGYIGVDVDQLLIAMYYTPALIDALFYIKDFMRDEEVHQIENDIWYRSIANRLEQLGENIDSLDMEDNIPNLAMKILDDVNERALISITRIFGVTEET